MRPTLEVSEEFWGLARALALPAPPTSYTEASLVLDGFPFSSMSPCLLYFILACFIPF